MGQKLYHKLYSFVIYLKIGYLFTPDRYLHIQELIYLARHDFPNELSVATQTVLEAMEKLYNIKGTENELDKPTYIKILEDFVDMYLANLPDRDKVIA